MKKQYEVSPTRALELRAQLDELFRQISQPKGSPINPDELSVQLQSAIEGRFGARAIHEFPVFPQCCSSTEKLIETSPWLKGKNFWPDHWPLSISYGCLSRRVVILRMPCNFGYQEALEAITRRGLLRPEYEDTLRFAALLTPHMLRWLGFPGILFPHQAQDGRLLSIREWQLSCDTYDFLSTRRDTGRKLVNPFEKDSWVVAGIRVVPPSSLQ